MLSSINANKRQVGGTHYQTQKIQHWDVMWSLYREAWFVGNVTKYVLRYRAKGGLQDLDKAKHYLEKLIELESMESSGVMCAKKRSYGK